MASDERSMSANRETYRAKPKSLFAQGVVKKLDSSNTSKSDSPF